MLGGTIEVWPIFFRTNVIGEDMIVSLDLEFNRAVLRQETVFEIGYPANFLHFFGDDNMSATGSLHRQVRNHALRLFGPQNLRQAIFHDLQRAARGTLLTWLDQPVVDLREAISQGRKNAIKMLEQQFLERKSAPKRPSVDFLDLLMDELKKQDSLFNEKIALNLIFGLMIASQETTSIGLTIVLKFLTEDPKALEELTEEHHNIRRKMVDPESEITWEDYKSMKFTFQVT